MLNTLGIFDIAVLTDLEKNTITQKKHYFWFGEVGMATILAGLFAIPLGIFLAGLAEIPLAFIGATVLFLPVFVFLPKLIRQAMKVDINVVTGAFGKNEQVKKVFWTLFLALAGLVLARVMDPVTAQQIVTLLTGAGIQSLEFLPLFFLLTSIPNDLSQPFAGRNLPTSTYICLH